MEVIQQGKIKEGTIVFEKPLPLPEGTEVVVRIEPIGAPWEPLVPQGKVADFLALPCFGMWADREDMKDSVAWVRREREKWQQRAYRQD
jgi:hypothetical protein